MLVKLVCLPITVKIPIMFWKFHDILKFYNGGFYNSYEAYGWYERRFKNLKFIIKHTYTVIKK